MKAMYRTADKMITLRAAFNRQLIFLWSFWLILIASTSIAQSLEERKKLQDDYIESNSKNPSVYQSAPVTQVVPKFNTISYALLLEQQSVSIEAEEDVVGSDFDHNLKINGFTISPHLSISLKSIGLGFSTEFGQRSSTYAIAPKDGRNSLYALQQSTLSYRGLGSYLYWIMPQSFSKRVKPSFTFGNSVFIANQRVSNLISTNRPISEDELQSRLFTYNVTKTEIGLNVGMTLLRKFTLIPWVNYEHFDISDGKRKLESDQLYDSSEKRMFEEDLQLFWRSKPSVKYGLDFSIRVFNRVELHVGGLLGRLVSIGEKNPRIEDKSLSFSLSLDQKGN